MDLHRNLIAAALLSAIGTADAADLTPIAGRGIALGQVAGVAYYTVEDEGYRVVATLVAGENARAIRFEAVLAPGQHLVLSTPREAGTAPDAVEISREDDRLVVRQASFTN
jgi:hypothetical protein